MRCDRGQASLEYLGLVALIVVVLGALAVPAAAGRDLAGGVVRQVHRALCVVRGGECENDRRPCVVASEERSGGWHVNVGIFRVGRERMIIRERHSDGTFATTEVRDWRSGLEVGVGADAAFSIGSRRIAAGATARAAGLVRLGGGTTVVRDGDRVVTREHVSRGGMGAELMGVVGRRGASAEGGGSRELLAGRVVDEASGRTTYVLNARRELWGAVASGRRRATTAAGGDLALTLTRDRDGRFVDLGLAATGELSAMADLPIVATPVLGDLRVGAAGGRRWALEQHLDLTDPGNAAAAGDLVDVLTDPGDPGGVLRAAAALGRQLARSAVTDVRVYDLARDDARNGGHIGIGGRFGYGDERHAARARLLSAMQRGPDGMWRRRTDCIDA
jgi:hypothetical protein